MKTTEAQTTLEINCNCPYCDAYLDITDESKEYLDETLRTENDEIEIRCEECNDIFIVDKITY
jgi:uncharacterized Zn finger protein